MAATLHPFEAAQASAVNAIHAHYVLNSVATFTSEPSTDDEMCDKLSALSGRGYPCVTARDADGTVLGFCYLSGFRSAKSGYAHTAELSLWCHTDHRRRGLGGLLLDKVVEIAREPDKFPEYVKPVVKLRQIIICMSMDEAGPKGGQGLVDFYARHGFEVVGGLRKVGYKFDRWWALYQCPADKDLCSSRKYYTGLTLRICRNLYGS